MINLTQFLAVIWALWGLNFILTLCRATIRWRVQGGKYVLEDFFAFLGFICLTALTAVITVAAPNFYTIQNMMIQTITDPTAAPSLSPDEMLAMTTLSLKLMFAQMLLFWSTLWGGKFSLLVFFRRMVLGLPKYLKIFWVVFALVMITYLGCMVSNFLTCKPLKKYWSATGCSDPDNVRRADESIRFATGADIAADFLIMLLPLKLLWNLHISRRQKIGLGCMFSLGIIVVVFAFIRLHNVTQATATSRIDPTKMAEGPVKLALWSQIEAAVAIIVANLPAFRSLLRTSGTTTHPSQPYYGGKSYQSRSAGTHRSMGHHNTIPAEQSSERYIRNYSTELQSLDSLESSNGGRGDARNGLNHGNGIVRTTEFEIRSARRSSDKPDDYHARPFGTN